MAATAVPAHLNHGDALGACDDGCTQDACIGRGCVNSAIDCAIAVAATGSP